MAVCTSFGSGRYVASEGDFAAWERLALPQVPRAVVSLQGSHGLASFQFTSAEDIARTQAFVAAGFNVYSGDISQTSTQGTYGNDTVVTRIGQLRTWATGSAPALASSGKLCLIGGSGGCTAAINYARANPTLVGAMWLIAPLVDIEDFYTNWLNGGANGTTPGSPSSGVTASEINKAYNNGVDDAGVAFTAAMPSHNPIRTGNQAALAGVPMVLAYSTNDPFIDVNKVNTYASLVNAAGGSATLYNQGAVGHSGLGVVASDVVSFFRKVP